MRTKSIGALLAGFGWAAVSPAIAIAVPQVAPGERAATAVPEPGSQLRVWLVTMGPGDEVWERYGHNAIRILDTTTGRDASYNWGVFDFRQEDFTIRFLRGRMLYMVAAYQSRPMIDAYARLNREVVQQELDLTPAQKLELLTLVERNVRPENAEYTYQYYRDNCSTRVRDMLDAVLGGRIRTQFGDAPTGKSYRYHTRRLTAVDPLVSTALDALLGAPTDHELTVWEEMFIPMTLRDRVREVTVPGDDGVERPLVLEEEVLVSATREGEPTAPPRWLPFYLLIGVALGALFSSLASSAVQRRPWVRRSVVVVATAWTLLGGVLGTVLVLLLLTDHTFAYWNENLFLFNPMLLAGALLVPLSGFRAEWAARARSVSIAVVVLALAGLVWQVAPWSRHHNAVFFALAIPAHLGLAWGLGVRWPTSVGRSQAAG